MHFIKRVNLFVVLSIALFNPISGQYTCGSFTKVDLNASDTKYDAYDRFGNGYTLEELTLPSTKEDHERSSINTGFFNLQYFNFPDEVTNAKHPNFGEDLRPVIEQVFADLSEIITQRNLSYACEDNLSIQKVNVNVTTDITGGDPNIDPETSPIAGVGSPYFILSHYYDIPECNHILESSTWNKINSRGYFFAENLSDGIIGINLDNVDIEYGTDWSAPAEPGKVDLYSVVLHEALHMLGFASKVDLSGAPTTLSGSNASFYSRYDQLLSFADRYNPMANPDAKQLIQGDCIHNCFNLDNEVSDFEAVIGSSCGNGEFDVFIGGDINAAISGTNGNTISSVNGLSHLDESCSNENYVMDPSINRGEEDRTLSIAELKILCQLGYDFNDDLIPGGCNDCFASANFDHPLRILDDMTVEYIQSCCFEPLATTVNKELIIDLNVLLCNDFPRTADDITEIFTIHDFGSSLMIERLPNDKFSFISSKKGIYPIYYTIKNCACYLSTSFFMVEVSQGLEECDLPLCDNLICNGDFDNLKKSNDYYLESDYFNRFIFEDGIQNTPDVCEDGQNMLLNLVNIIGPEGLVFNLDHPVEPGCTMNISLDLASRLDTESALNILGSEFSPCFPADGFINMGCNFGNDTQVQTDCGAYTYIPFCIVKDKSIDNKHPGLLCPDQGVSLQEHQWTFTNESDLTINYIVLYNSVKPSTIWLDNLVVTQNCPPVVSVDAQVPILKTDTEETITIELCFSDDSSPGFIGADVLAEVQLPLGLDFAVGGDFTQGEATVQGLAEGECVDLALALIADTDGEYLIDVITSVTQLCASDTFSIDLKAEGASSIFDIDYTRATIKNPMVRVYDFLGRQIYSEDYNPIEIKSIRNRIPSTSNGVYIITLFSDDILVKTERILLMR